MRLVHIKSIHPYLLEGDDIILPFFGFQFGEPVFQLFAGAFQLLDGKLLAALVLEFFDTMRNVIQRSRRRRCCRSCETGIRSNWLCPIITAS